MAKFDELDHRIIDCESYSIPIEELANFSVDPRDCSKSLQVVKDLLTEVEEKLKVYFVKI